MPDNILTSWPDYAVLSQYGEGATLKDDMGRGTLSIAVVLPYWIERAVFAQDHKTGMHAQLRLLSPLDGGGTSPYTLKAIYSLQGAMLKELQPELGTPRVKSTNTDCPAYSIERQGEGGIGAIGIQRINRNWLGLTVEDEDFAGHQGANGSSGEDISKPAVVTLFFNRLRSPRVYQALSCLGHAIRQDNRFYPREEKQTASIRLAASAGTAYPCG